MNAVAESRLRMMLAAGKHRLEEKGRRAREDKELDGDRAKLARAEKVLRAYQDQHGPLTCETPAHVLDLSRQVAHHRAMIDDPKYRYWFKTRTVHTDHLPPPRADRLREIWAAILCSDRAAKLPQQARIANVKNRGRICGLGRAARLAGF
jgi:hypothetical protein